MFRFKGGIPVVNMEYPELRTRNSLLQFFTAVILRIHAPAKDISWILVKPNLFRKMDQFQRGLSG